MCLSMGLATISALMQTVMVAVAHAATVQNQIPELRARVYLDDFFFVHNYRVRDKNVSHL